jgi:hypothetical protein
MKFPSEWKVIKFHGSSHQQSVIINHIPSLTSIKMVYPMKWSLIITININHILTIINQISTLEKCYPLSQSKWHSCYPLNPTPTLCSDLFADEVGHFVPWRLRIKDTTVSYDMVKSDWKIWNIWLTTGETTHFGIHSMRQTSSKEI